MALLPEKSTLLLPFRRPPTSNSFALRVGLVVDGLPLRPWVDALSSYLKDIPGLDVRILTTASHPSISRRALPWLTDRLYCASRAKFDPFGNVDRRTNSPVPVNSADEIRNAGCDILIWLTSLNGRELKIDEIVKHGALSVRLGNRNQLIPFWDEVVHNAETSTTRIFWHGSSFDKGHVVQSSETSSVLGLYLTMNSEKPLVATIRLLANVCLEISGNPLRFEEKVRQLPEVSMETSCEAYPSSFEAGRFICQKLLRSAQLRFKGRRKTARWFLALRPNAGNSITDADHLNLAGFKEIRLPPRIEAADPFLIEKSGRQYLFFEAMEGSPKGRIAYLEISEDGSCSEMQVILDRSYHLSYPCIVAAGDDLFLLPESSEATHVDLFRFSRFPDQLEMERPLLEGLSVVDTTPIFVDGRWYFFTTTVEPFMETLLFWSDRLDGQWNLHPENPVSCSVRNCRSAGNLFWRNGRLYRPTQDCSVRYGYAICVNEVTALTPTLFSERPANWIRPTWSSKLLGTHTWNESSRWQVIDGIRYIQAMK